MIKLFRGTSSYLAIALVIWSGIAGAATVNGASNQKLVDAIRANDHTALKAALATGASANYVLPDTTTPIYLAVDKQDTEALRMLLAAGAKAQVKDQDGNTPLVVACHLGEASIVNALLDAKADPKAVGQGNVPAFVLCAGTSSPAVLERMIRAGNAVDQASAGGQTALMFAAARGRLENIQVLLRNGAHVNAASNTGWTPIMFAMRGGSLPAAQALIAAGADVSHVTPDGDTALQIALEDKNVPFAVMLVNSGAALNGNWDLHGRPPLQAAVLMRDPELVKLMISKGANPNEPSRLAYGINPNDISYNPPPGDTRFTPRKPIDFKALGYTPRIMLHTNPDGGGPARIPSSPSTALLVAAQTGQADLMKALVAGGANAKFVNGDGNNVLLLAAASRKLEAVKYAYEVFPDIKTAQRDGSNLLHIVLGGAGGGGGNQLATAVSNDELLETTNFLIDQGVSVDAKNSRGQTPLALALDRGDLKMQALFRRVVADRAAKGNPVAEDAAVRTRGVIGTATN